MQIKIKRYNVNVLKFLYALSITLLALFELYLFVGYIKIIITNI